MLPAIHAKHLASHGFGIEKIAQRRRYVIEVRAPI
jgi:hypothetical protein